MPTTTTSEGAVRGPLSLNRSESPNSSSMLMPAGSMLKRNPVRAMTAPKIAGLASPEIISSPSSIFIVFAAFFIYLLTQNMDEIQKYSFKTVL